jgi:hexosaminidase
MSHPVIPAPVRFDAADGQFTLRPGTPIAYPAAPELAPIAERFIEEISRRTGLHLAPTVGHPGPDEPSVRIELAPGDELGVLSGEKPQGLSPGGGSPQDERYDLTITAGQVLMRAAEPVGVARALTTLTQLLAAAPGSTSLPGANIVDAPRYAWRGLSLDLARTYLTPDEIRRVIDLLALYKLNVLHMHLTDDQSWRLPAGRPAGTETPYSADELRALVAYALDRFVNLVPEVDMPGHMSALLGMHPELNAGRSQAGQQTRAAWLDPTVPATFPLVEDVLTGVAGIFPSPYLHLGGDEPWGMPRDLYVSFVRHVRAFVRTMGKRPLGWQESARAGLDETDIIQYWLSGIALAPSLPAEVVAKIDADVALARRDVETLVAAKVPVIVSPQSHCYLDVPYAEPSADPGQADRQGRAGLRLYAPMTVAHSFDWEPSHALGEEHATQVAGVEAAIWAETVSDFGDLTFLLLPRLPGVATKAWSAPQASAWAEHRDRLARHARLWAQDDLTYFRTSAVNWP